MWLGWVRNVQMWLSWLVLRFMQEEEEYVEHAALSMLVKGEAEPWKVARSVMIRVMSYNILSGGPGREEPLLAMIQSRRPDIVGLIEATDDTLVERLAKRLGMEERLSGRTKDREGQQGALLSRLPIRSTTLHITPILSKQPLLEVCMDGPDGQPLTVFVAHLTASFSQGWRADRKRRREVQELLRKMAQRRGTPHLLIGDFNSVAPGEHVQGSKLLSFVLNLCHYPQLYAPNPRGLPDLNYIVPRPLRFLKPMLRLAAKNRMLSLLLDRLDRLYAPRGGYDLLIKAGYVDCFRTLHPEEPGYTWPSPMPAGRIDFIFASPELARRLVSCEVIGEGKGLPATQASDHLPVVACFDMPASC